jgi:hypothetical protein
MCNNIYIFPLGTLIYVLHQLLRTRLDGPRRRYRCSDDFDSFQGKSFLNSAPVLNPRKKRASKAQLIKT